MIVITDGSRIRRHQRDFVRSLHSPNAQTINCWVGYPGGNFNGNVTYFPSLDIWLSSRALPNRCWNGFGIGRPKAGANNSLTGEINFPNHGINRRVAAVFAEDDHGAILVLHRGRIGGGKPGIGKTHFTNNFRGDFVSAVEGGKETTFCLVGELYSSHFPAQVADFLREIYRIKELRAFGNHPDFTFLSDFIYTDEKSGVIVTERSEPTTIKRTHGLVVNALARQLKETGFEVGNDRNRDLYVHSAGKITHLFEIKTSSSTQSLFAALGQLLLYSIAIPNAVSLIAVLPDRLAKNVAAKFRSLGVQIVYYQWQLHRPVFPTLPRIISPRK